MSELLFVYGTLRRGSGHPQGVWLAEQAQWLGRARVGGRLYRISYYPGLVPDVGASVWGDAYRLPEAGLAALWERLDAFEEIRGQADDEYYRGRGVVRLESGEVVEAWIYWFQGDTAGLDPVPGGDWMA